MSKYVIETYACIYDHAKYINEGYKEDIAEVDKDSKSISTSDPGLKSIRNVSRLQALAQKKKDLMKKAEDEEKSKSGNYGRSSRVYA